MVGRKPVIGVMGGAEASEETVAMAQQLGSLIANRGWVLLNGGRNAGVMAASARGAKDAGGVVIGVLPDRSRAQASPDLDFAIMTGMGDGRNVINILSSDVVVACRGGMGTLCEVTLALKNSKRVILLGLSIGPEFDSYRKQGQLTSAADPAEAVEQAATALEA